MPSSIDTAAGDSNGRAVETPPGVDVVIDSNSFASELYLVDHGYAQVGKGVGRLELTLAPGQYKVRQRIGFCEQVQDLTVAATPARQSVQLPPLAFPSPFPLEGTAPAAAAAEAGAPSEAPGSGALRFVLRVPAGASAMPNAAAEPALRAEMKRLRLEQFDGTLLAAFEPTAVFDEGAGELVFGCRQPPGRYVLVQGSDSDQQVCMPVAICADRTTLVCSLLLADDGKPVLVDLAHAAVAILGDDAQGPAGAQSLRRLEAARKAVAADRRLYGWSNDFAPAGEPSLPQPENVLLDLLDVYLGWRCLERTSSDDDDRPAASNDPLLPVSREALLSRLARAAAVLGSDSADVVALLNALDAAPSPDLAAPRIGAPPLMKKTWDRLLSFREGNVQAGAVMAFPCQIRSSPTWLLWSEKAGDRARALAQAKDKPMSIDVVRANAPRAPGPGGHQQAGYLALFSMALSAAQTYFAPAWKSQVVTAENVQAVLAAMLGNASFQQWLGTVETILASDRASPMDDTLRRLIATLRPFADPTLLAALGPEAIVRQVLLALRLPQSRIVPLVTDILDRIVSELDHADQAALLKSLWNSVSATSPAVAAPPAAA